MSHVVYIVYRLGPYHIARLNALSRRVRVTALEMTTLDTHYDWVEQTSKRDFETVTMFPHEDVTALPGRRVRQKLWKVLESLDPSAVIVNGWADRVALGALWWCIRNERPRILLSDSTVSDQRRNAIRETLKSMLVKTFSSAFVAGTPQRDYIRRLGMSAERIYMGLDVVDNQFFCEGAEAVRRNAANYRKKLDIRRPFFLTVTRLVPKEAGIYDRKNGLWLIGEYARYVRVAGEGAWDLFILGDGGMRLPMESLAASLGISHKVRFEGFVQYDEMPVYYALAEAFFLASKMETWGLVVNEAMACGLPVLVSTGCGCIADLLRQGQNGYSFDPTVDGALSKLFGACTRKAETLSQMGIASTKIIADWSIERSAKSLISALGSALDYNRYSQTSWVSSALLGLMMFRS